MVMAVLGIDLGTTNSVVASVKGGEVVIVPDRQGRRLHPSVVAFMPDGTEAVLATRRWPAGSSTPSNTIYSAKRLMGQSFGSDEANMAAQRIPYDAGSRATTSRWWSSGPDRTYTIPEISGLLLSYLRQCAQLHLGDEVTGAVITVPANFNNAQRQATMDAGRIAGLNVLRVINEPTAAALAYGLGRGMSQRIAVFDFGGGTFDVTILQVEGEIFEVLATGGDSFLGGDDIDEAVMTLMAAQFEQQHGSTRASDPAIKARLIMAAEQIKRHLSRQPEARGELKVGTDADGAPLVFTFHLTRAGVRGGHRPAGGAHDGRLRRGADRGQADPLADRRGHHGGRLDPHPLRAPGGRAPLRPAAPHRHQPRRGGGLGRGRAGRQPGRRRQRAEPTGRCCWT